MSWTSSLAHKPDYWTYSAEIMRRDMEDILKSKHIVAAAIQKGIHSQLSYFFKLAVDGKNYNSASEKNREAHFTLCQFIWAQPSFKDASDDEVNAQMQKLSDFHSSLLEDRELEEVEIATVEFLIQLYLELARQGYDDRRASRASGCY